MCPDIWWSCKHLGQVHDANQRTYVPKAHSRDILDISAGSWVRTCEIESWGSMSIAMLSKQLLLYIIILWSSDISISYGTKTFKPRSTKLEILSVEVPECGEAWSNKSSGSCCSLSLWKCHVWRTGKRSSTQTIVNISTFLKEPLSVTTALLQA